MERGGIKLWTDIGPKFKSMQGLVMGNPVFAHADCKSTGGVRSGSKKEACGTCAFPNQAGCVRPTGQAGRDAAAEERWMVIDILS